jgi:hypothetical protein
LNYCTYFSSFSRHYFGEDDTIDNGRLARLIALLENERFGVREKAAEELLELPDLAEPALRKALTASSSLETLTKGGIMSVHSRIGRPTHGS